MTKKKRLLILDSIRGLAVIMVIIYHYFYRYNEIYLGAPSFEFLSLGKYGVQLFFLISGFVIYWSVKSNNSHLSFLKSRFARLYPAYWLAIILSFAVVNTLGLPGREAIWPDLVKNVIMFHAYFGVKHVDGVYWTLTIELTFYLWVAIFLWLRKIDFLPYLLILFILIGQFQEFAVINLPIEFRRLFIYENASFFLAGLSFYQIFQKRALPLSYVCIAICLVDAFLIFSIQHGVLFLSFYIFMYLAIKGKIDFLNNRTLSFLGSISYSLYLIHQNIGYSIIYNLDSLGFNHYLSLASALGTCLMLSKLMFDYVELPFQRLITKGHFRKN